MPKTKVKKKVPKFKNEDLERDFWSDNDSADYVDWQRGRRIVFSELKPSTKTISLRLPEAMLENLKLLANKRDIPYQSLLKIFLAERMEEEFNHQQ